LAQIYIFTNFNGADPELWLKMNALTNKLVAGFQAAGYKGNETIRYDGATNEQFNSAVTDPEANLAFFIVHGLFTREEGSIDINPEPGIILSSGGDAITPSNIKDIPGLNKDLMVRISACGQNLFSKEWKSVFPNTKFIGNQTDPTRTVDVETALKKIQSMIQTYVGMVQRENASVVFNKIMAGTLTVDDLKKLTPEELKILKANLQQAQLSMDPMEAAATQKALEKAEEQQHRDENREDPTKVVNDIAPDEFKK
jgi:hypothetical protein